MVLFLLMSEEMNRKEGWVVVKKGTWGKGWRAADVRDLSPVMCPLSWATDLG